METREPGKWDALEAMKSDLLQTKNEALIFRSHVTCEGWCTDHSIGKGGS